MKNIQYKNRELTEQILEIDEKPLFKYYGCGHFRDFSFP